jgi:hypothetical protein
MASSKNQKSAPVRSNQNQPKAGPKSNNGGRKKNNGRAVNTNSPSLFDRIRNDIIEEQKSRREEAKQKPIANQLKFRTAQAELAKTLIGMTPGLTYDVAILIIDNFVIVTPSNGIKRTMSAEMLILEQLTTEQLTHKQTVDNGRYIARKALLSAYNQLTQFEMA